MALSLQDIAAGQSLEALLSPTELNRIKSKIEKGDYNPIDLYDLLLHKKHVPLPLLRKIMDAVHFKSVVLNDNNTLTVNLYYNGTYYDFRFRPGMNEKPHTERQKTRSFVYPGDPTRPMTILWIIKSCDVVSYGNGIHMSSSIYNLNLDDPSSTELDFSCDVGGFDGMYPPPGMPTDYAGFTLPEKVKALLAQTLRNTPAPLNPNYRPVVVEEPVDVPRIPHYLVRQ